MSDEMVDIPPTRFGRRQARRVRADESVRVQLRLPAPMVRRLTLAANARGTSLAHLVAQQLATDEEACLLDDLGLPTDN
ncbi:hypothetical protein QVA66_10005 [Staphylococcus chromogenes]|nr:hypothetical protein [Staphylococcus chromogenes]